MCPASQSIRKSSVSMCRAFQSIRKSSVSMCPASGWRECPWVHKVPPRMIEAEIALFISKSCLFPYRLCSALKTLLPQTQISSLAKTFSYVNHNTKSHFTSLTQSIRGAFGPADKFWTSKKLILYCVLQYKINFLEKLLKTFMPRGERSRLPQITLSYVKHNT